MMGDGKMKALSAKILLVVLGAALLVAYSSFYTVTEMQQALVLEFGKKVRIVKEPGLYVKLPWRTVMYMEKRILALDPEAEELLASDQKRLIVDAFARFRIADPFLYYQAVRTVENARSKLEGLMDSSLRQVLGNAPMSAVLSAKRVDLITHPIKKKKDKAHEFGLDVLDVRIKRADLPDANRAPVYARMKAERDREAREFRAKGAEQALRIKSKADRDRTVLLAEADRKSEILRGEGEAKAVGIFAKAFNKDVDFFEFYRSMQAYRKALGSDTTMVLSPKGEFFRYLQDASGKQK
jgi:membrane protease subunit HflC